MSDCSIRPIHITPGAGSRLQMHLRGLSAVVEYVDSEMPTSNHLLHHLRTRIDADEDHRRIQGNTSEGINRDSVRLPLISHRDHDRHAGGTFAASPSTMIRDTILRIHHYLYMLLSRSRSRTCARPSGKTRTHTNQHPVAEPENLSPLSGTWKCSLALD
jgi:hypothetical protein